MADIKTRRLLRRTLGSGGWANPTFTLYPLTTGVPATGAISTPAGPGWAAAYTDIIGAGAITVEFWLMQVMYDSVGAVTELYDVQIYNLTQLTTVFEDKVDLTAVEANVAPTDIFPPVYCNPSDRIQWRAGAAAATALHASLLVATGL